MRFKDFLLSCSNSEVIHIFINHKCVAKGLCEDFIVDDNYQDMKVNTFFSWCDGNRVDSIYNSYIEVYLK